VNFAFLRWLNRALRAWLGTVFYKDALPTRTCERRVIYHSFNWTALAIAVYGGCALVSRNCRRERQLDLNHCWSRIETDKLENAFFSPAMVL
jgi:hypothetical protein